MVFLDESKLREEKKIGFKLKQMKKNDIMSNITSEVH